MQIRTDDLSGPEIANFLEEHLEDMRSVSPPESKHALDLDGLRSEKVTFWVALSARELVGCIALKELDPTHGEIKSMRTKDSVRGRGVGRTLLQHIILEARLRKYVRLSLETGRMPFFLPARTLYASVGFIVCDPFSDYKPDPNSVFMTIPIQG
ncbi:GNAT family N-acetyltransferase [Pelagicoccus albus]|uniref:GNAT family N-acetyltransferase n=1 Tax=Pelagicoccus albus TaxID=415222 RepID=A0A7X1B8L1_9BACT|nr:GNAT family N-acetyltransferase [Pelagicoccus albus]